MLRVPLKTDILLITRSGIFVCKIEFAGKDTFKSYDVRMRKYVINSDQEYIDIPISDQVIFDRNTVDGFSTIQDSSLDEIYNQCKITENHKIMKTDDKKIIQFDKNLKGRKHGQK